MPETLHKAILALGSNVGDRADWLKRAAEAISELHETCITDRSSIYETEAVDVPHAHRGKSFLNAVLLLRTALTPEELSLSIHAIEDQLQRTRSRPNQPRTIDIDIITYDNTISDNQELTLPHPRAHQRRFVLEPMAEVAPELTLPGQSASVTELLDSLPRSPWVTSTSKVW